MPLEIPFDKIQSRESLLSTELQSKIELIDKTIFSVKSLDVHLDVDTESKAEASHHFDDSDLSNEKEHFYTVWEKGIKNNKLTEKDNPEKEVLRIALHEVRHRVQHDLNAKMLNISDLKQFIVENPKTSLETYFSSPDYKKFLDYMVSSNKSKNDFDAMVVEDIAMKLLRGNYDDESIEKVSNDIIKQSANVIIDYLNSLQTTKEKFGTNMYDNKYGNKEEIHPRSVVTYFVDKYLNQSKNCLDLGSGAGRHSKYIAEKGIKVTAIDLSEVGVEKTKEVLSIFPDSQVLVGDIHNLPFENESFDSLVCNRVLDYNDDTGLEAAFSEIERVVKKDGIVLITVRSVSQQPKQEEILIIENSNGGKSFKVADSPQVQHYFTEQEIKDLANKHNFNIAEIREDLHVNSEKESKAEWQVILKKLQ